MSTMTQTSSASTSTWLNKVPEVTIIFGLLKYFQQRLAKPLQTILLLMWDGG